MHQGHDLELRDKSMANRLKKPTEVIATKMAGDDHAVLTVVGGNGDYLKKPCVACPWRKSNAGSFPAEAFRHSANTACDMATHTFACHMTGKEHPATCAGFLLVGADDNMSVRIKRAQGEMLDVQGDLTELHESYRAMAVANGVPEDDPAIEGCMPEARERFFSRRG